MLIVLPLYVQLGRTSSKKRYLNLNAYRNNHHRVNNNIKIQFKNQVAPLVKGVIFKSPIIIRYTLYPKTKRLCDVANVCSVVDKCFSDVLVEMGCIPDDNYLYLKGVSYEIGEVDKDNARVEASIQELI